MSVNYNKASDYSPAKVGTPNSRFATTFLSNRYRKYAIEGESLMDKATGEIFTKRKGDGKIVSFFQDKKYIDNSLFDLRMILNSHPDFKVPDMKLERTKEALFLDTDYDVMSINNEEDVDIKNKNIVITNQADSINSLNFKISNQSNGFICNLITRDSDRVAIEMITTCYNNLVKDYNGSDATILAEKDNFENEEWEFSNATIEYNVSYTKNGTTTGFNSVGYVNLNSQSLVLFPKEKSTEYAGADSFKVTITSVKFEKIQFMIKNGSKLSSTFETTLDKLSAYDKSIYVRYISIMSFVDSFDDIETLGNEIIKVLLGMTRLYTYVNDTTRLASSSPVLLSPTRPMLNTWDTNCIWAEQISKSYGNGTVVEIEHEVDIDKLEEYLSGHTNTQFANFTLNSADETDVLLTPKISKEGV